MGCRNLTYYEAGEGIEKSPLKILGAPEEKIPSLIFCNNYTPFGLTFNSYKRENIKKNNFGFNGIENISDLGLNVNMYMFRTYDPALGRWWQIDPLYKHFESPYATVTNNPISYIDLLGLDTLRMDDENFSWDNVKDDDVVIGPEVLQEVTVKNSYSSMDFMADLFSGNYQFLVHMDPENANSNEDSNFFQFDSKKSSISIDLTGLDWLFDMMNKRNPFKRDKDYRNKEATEKRNYGEKTTKDVKPDDPSTKEIKEFQEAMNENNQNGTNDTTWIHGHGESRRNLDGTIEKYGVGIVKGDTGLFLRRTIKN